MVFNLKFVYQNNVINVRGDPIQRLIGVGAILSVICPSKHLTYSCDIPRCRCPGYCMFYVCGMFSAIFCYPEERSS